RLQKNFRAGLPIGASARRFDAIAWLRRYGTTLFLVLLLVFFACQNERFISLRNLTNILTEGSIYGIIAVRMMLVIVTVGVDLARRHPHPQRWSPDLRLRSWLSMVGYRNDRSYPRSCRPVRVDRRRGLHRATPYTVWPSRLRCRRESRGRSAQRAERRGDRHQ